MNTIPISRDAVEQALYDALKRAKQDINWMLNSQQFLNGYVFNYIDEALAQADQPKVPQAQAGEPETDATFEEWWESNGQYHRAGGGDYEKTFAYRAWETALQSHREAIKVIHDDWELDVRQHREAIAKKDAEAAELRAALAGCVEALKQWAIVRESVLDVGFGDDVRTGGKPELGYALIPEIPTFSNEDEASAAIAELGLPLGWVRMPLSRLIPDIDAAITQAQEVLK